MSVSPEVQQLDVAEARDKLISDNEEWLGRSANLLRYIGEHFVNTRMRGDTLSGRRLADGQYASTASMFTTPRIVLPAQPLSSQSGVGNSIVRHSATQITVYYDLPKFNHLKGAGYMRAEDAPVPDEVNIVYPHPIALTSDIKDSETKQYRYGDCISISGNSLPMLAWSADTLAASLPMRRTKNFRDTDELMDFDVFREIPIEAIHARPDAVEYHQKKLARFIESLSAIALAVNDPELNPRIK